MSDERDKWLKGNSEYLEAALAWLRLKLEQLAEHRATHTPLVVTSSPPPSRKGWFKRAPEWEDNNTIAPATGVAPAHQQLVTPHEVQRAAAQMEELAQKLSPPPALLVLSQQLNLSEFERQVLLLCVALEMDTRIGPLCARANGDLSRAYPTFALALSLFENPSFDLKAPHRPLRSWRLIEINQPAPQTLMVSALRADERITNYVNGINYLDDRLLSLVSPVARDSNLLPPAQMAQVQKILQRWKSSNPDIEPDLGPIQLVGSDRLSKQLVASEAAAELYHNHHQLYHLPVELLPSQAGELDTLARLWQRESILLPLVLYLEAEEVENRPADSPASALERFLERSGGLFFVATREVLQSLSQSRLALDIERPTHAEQRAAWQEFLGDRANGQSGQLAAEFNLNIPVIRQLAEAALADPGNDNDPAEFGRRLWDSCSEKVRPRLDALAQRLDLKMTWDDLILPEEETNLLHLLLAQVAQRSLVYEEWGFARQMNRGLGISALFAGDSGTGKTMAAEVIANTLRLNLYRIDLSAVVSKYIGETEKNLRRLFDAAEDGGSILFFDEADALFGKRSEVKDSHDRYANIEINYLLQRMEAYRGLAILASNMKSALDTAFLRRLRFVVNFPFPGQAERKRMWQRVFPSGVPLDNLDYDRLARFNLTGGNIHNVALAAAFLAAQAGSSVTMPLILKAARAEYRKLERPINEADFRLPEPPKVKV